MGLFITTAGSHHAVQGPTLSADPPRGPIAPGKNFRFGILEFVADQLGALLALPRTTAPSSPPSALASTCDLAEVTSALDRLELSETAIPRKATPLEADWRLISGPRIARRSAARSLRRTSRNSGSGADHSLCHEVLMIEDIDATPPKPVDPKVNEIADILVRREYTLRNKIARVDAERRELRRQRPQFQRESVRCPVRHNIAVDFEVHEKDGVPIYAHPTGNLIAAASIVRHAGVVAGTPGFEALRQVRVLIEEETCQIPATPGSASPPRASPTRSSSKVRDGRPQHSGETSGVSTADGPGEVRWGASVRNRVGASADIRQTLDARRRNAGPFRDDFRQAREDTARSRRMKAAGGSRRDRDSAPKNDRDPHRSGRRRGRRTRHGKRPRRSLSPASDTRASPTSMD